MTLPKCDKCGITMHWPETHKLLHEPALPRREVFDSMRVVAAHALDAPNGEGRWLANMHGTWQEFEVRKEEARFVMPGYGWHPIKWYIDNGWGRWQAVAACSATKHICD